jgi:hypothetical protein
LRLPLLIGAENPLGNKKIKVARFSTCKDSAESFEQRFGQAVKGKKDAADFAQTLVRIGFNTGKAENGGRAGFANYLEGIINAVKGRLSC